MAACTDCYTTGAYTSDGKCSNCQGTGKQPPNPLEAVAVIGMPLLASIPAEEVLCEKCSGTCQCQTCGGTGVVQTDAQTNQQTSCSSYDGNTNKEEQGEDEDEYQEVSHYSTDDEKTNESQDNEGSGSYSHGESGGTRTTGAAIILALIGVFAGIAIIFIGVTVVSGLINFFSKDHSNPTNVQKPLSTSAVRIAEIEGWKIVCGRDEGDFTGYCYAHKDNFTIELSGKNPRLGIRAFHYSASSGDISSSDYSLSLRIDDSPAFSIRWNTHGYDWDDDDSRHEASALMRYMLKGKVAKLHFTERDAGGDKDITMQLNNLFGVYSLLEQTFKERFKMKPPNGVTWIHSSEINQK